MTEQRSNSKMVVLLLLAMGLVLAFGLYFGVLHHRQSKVNAKDLKIEGTILQPGRTLPNFSLESSRGGQLTKKDLKNHWSILFFGFTNCGYVCPTTMSMLNKFYTSLQPTLPTKELPQVIMISVDPNRDTVARMKSYVESFNTNFIGARAPEEKILPLEQSLGVVAVKLEASQNKNSNNYAVNHSAELFLVDEEGNVIAYFSYPQELNAMIQDYTTVVTTLS